MNISLRDSKIHAASLEILENDTPETNSDSRQNPPVPDLHLAAIDIRTDHLPTFTNRIVLNMDSQEKPSPRESSSINIRSSFSKKAQISGRITIFLLFVISLILGRYVVPHLQTECVKDRILDVLAPANNFINEPGHENYRIFFQYLCSCFVDISFIITFGYWVLHGNTCRLPISLALFYLVRALVQAFWYSPFPEGFYWSDPGFPSLVVPYGRGSDFFFSGHSGFMLICALEWHRLGKSKVRNLVLSFTGYTVMILLIYRIHYSIDVFVGLFFADWCFWKIDRIREKIDVWWVNIFIDLRIWMKRLNKEDKVKLMTQDIII